jgi:hypothetical protein
MKEQLPDFLLAELYTDSLVYIKDEQKQQLKTEIITSKNLYLGNFQNKIVILVSDENNIYISDDNLNFLAGILSACKFNLSHIALINFYNNAVNFSSLKKDLQAEFLVSFGITTLQIELPFTMPDYQVQEYNKCKIIIAPSLNQLNQQTKTAKTEKTKLWKSLQKMFDLE